MAEISPQDVAATERLHRYWVHGEGAAKIAWNTPGDFDRCVMHLGKFIHDPRGYCNLAHKAATGMYPAQHAAEIRKATGRSSVAQAAAKPYGDVEYADPGYLDGDGNQVSKSGKKGVKRYPLSADKVMAAWSYINQADNAGQYTPEQLKVIKGKIMAAMKRHGHDVADQPSGRAESLAPYVRSFPLEDISIRSGGDGRTVEAYAAVFNTPAQVRDQDGHYMEEIDPVCFNRAISDAAPQGRRKDWRVGVFYNHAMTIHGTPSELFSLPAGIPLEISTDGHGVKTVTRYHRGEVCDMILERIREGSLPGYSFTGHFRRSNPLIPRGGFRPDRTGNLPTVRRMESTLVEYGPTPFPVYAGAAVTAMRSDMLTAMAADPDLAMRMLSMFRDGAPLDSPPLSGAPDPGLAAEDSHRLVRSGRPVKQEIQAARSAFLQRQHRR